MSVLVSLLAAGVLAQEQAQKTYKDTALGLIFQHPASWTVKSEKYSTNFSFPASDGSTAVVQVFRMSFRQPKADWQQIQIDMNAQLKRQITRQWEEQILGVPLLMTRLHYAEGSTDMSALVGLLYTATQEKLNFRVVSTAAGAQGAEDAWRAVLMTLRTVSGNLPVAEDPTRPEPNPTSGGGTKPVLTLKPGDAVKDPVRTKNVATLSKLGVSLSVFLPDGWKIEDKEGKTVLTSGDVKNPIAIEIVTGSMEEVSPMLKEAEKASFERFNIVSLREGSTMTRSKSGCLSSDTLRVGKTKEGADLVVWHLVGINESILWKIDYECASAADFKKERKAVEKLRDLFAIEIAK